MNARRTPAIYRLNDGDGVTEPRVSESLVWIVAAAPQVMGFQPAGDDSDRTEPKYQLMALVIFGNGTLNLVPAWMLEVIRWSDDDEALTMSLPPEPDRDGKGHIVHANHTSCDIVQDNVTTIRRLQ